MGSGDAGNATFKWNHNGTDYLGRDDPYQATWLAKKTVITNNADSTAVTNKPHILQADNGNWLCFYVDDTDNKASVVFSSDNGITWGGKVAVETVTNSSGFLWAIKLKSGRILVNVFGSEIRYSDDHGATWGSITSSTYFDAIELDNGNIYAVSGTSSVVGYVSTNGGFSFSSSITIASDTNSQGYPSVVQAKNGDIVVAYESDEDALNDIEIKCKISSDGGATFGSAIAVINFATDITNPRLFRDINGDLLCVAAETAAGLIRMSKSTDNGVTWTAGAAITVYSDGATHTVTIPTISLIDGHQVICTFVDELANSSDVYFVRRGIWEAFSANACPVAMNGIEQKLINDVGIKWYGGAGVVADDGGGDAGAVYCVLECGEPAACARDRAPS